MNNYKHQTAFQIVNTSTWSTDAPVYEEGAREKSTVWCPEDAPFNFLIGNHRYLSKKSNPRAQEQFWMEAISYRFGAIIGVDVPPSFVSIDSDGQCRALIEWFYDETNPLIAYHNAYSLLSRIDKDLDKEKGDRHTINIVLKCLNSFERLASKKYKVFHIKTFDLIHLLVKTFTFDALIGNTDRHHENWGLLFETNRNQLSIKLSPAFDNGTSLGYNFPEAKIARVLHNDQWFKGYADKGRHHIRSEVAKERFKHTDLVIELLRKFPEHKSSVVKTISFDISDVEAMVFDLCAFEVPVPLSENRAKFITKIIEAKQLALLEAIEEC